MKRPARRSDRLARLLALAGAFLTCAGHAAAQDLQVQGTLSQTFTFDSDLDLDDSGPSFGSTTSVGVSATYLTDDSDATISSSLSYRRFTEDDDGEDFDGFTPNINGSARFRLGRLTLTEGLSFRIDDVAFTEFTEEGTIDPNGIFTDADARRLDFTFSQGASYALTQRTSLGGAVGVSLTRFSETDDELSDSDRFFGSLSLSRAVSPRLSLSVSANASRFETGSDVEDTRGTSVGVSVGFNRLLQEDVTLGGRVGLRYVTVREEVSVFPLGRVESEESNIGVNGGFSFSYDVGQTDLFAGLSQDVAPTEDGEVEESTTLSAGLSHAINSRQSVNVGFSVTRRTNVTDTVGNNENTDQEFFGQISPSYSYRLTPSWSANLGYSFRLSNDEDGSNVSNSVFLGFSRPLRIFP
ncbi:MAG: hypothetical protein AAF371_10200 [Pseudomonadota bacterium]